MWTRAMWDSSTLLKWLDVASMIACGGMLILLLAVIYITEDET